MSREDDLDRLGFLAGQRDLVIDRAALAENLIFLAPDHLGRDEIAAGRDLVEAELPSRRRLGRTGELGIAVKEACLAQLTFASYAYPDFHLLMPLYICRRWEGTAMSREGQALKWVRPGKLRDLAMPPADEPLIPPLVDLLGG